jgi:hypothetical protein
LGSVLCLLALVGLGAPVPPVRADYVTATFGNVNPGEVVSISSDSGSTWESGWAGVYNFSNASGALTGNYSGFCIDIAQNIYSGQTATWTVANLANAPTPGTQMGIQKANLIAELWYNDYALIGSSNTNAAAFQIAIWAIINGTISNGIETFSISSNHTTLTSGSFQAKTIAYGQQPIDTTMVNTAYTWLENLNPVGTGSGAAGLTALTNPTYQDYVVQFPAPAPSGLLLGSTATVMLLALAWRRQRGLSYSAAESSG